MRFARMYAGADSVILIWSMGITMHSHGVENVQAIVNLGLAKGILGRAKSGLVPIRGHSGVQGGAEMGCVPNALPGGTPLSEAKHFSELWGFDVPSWTGMYVGEMVDAAHRGELDLLYCAGSNLFGVLPDSRYVEEAVGRIPVRVHHDIVLNPQMLVDPADTVLLLPATTRYEMVGGNCETTSERRVVYNPEIPGPRIPEARDEWRVLVELAQRVKPGAIGFEDTAAIRNEIARAVPFYAGIEKLAKKGDQFQWGGHQLAFDGKFKTPDGKAHFIPLDLPVREQPSGTFQLSTRRGKQFNSMVWGKKDMLVGGSREDILMDPADMQRQGLREGQKVTVRSEAGEMAAVVRTCTGAKSGMVQMYWPEANVLIGRSKIDPQCGILAYRETNVEIVPR
jgi:predicted molibdopterin-dependent oxidoreductase YjgC